MIWKNCAQTISHLVCLFRFANRNIDSCCTPRISNNSLGGKQIHDGHFTTEGSTHPRIIEDPANDQSLAASGSKNAERVSFVEFAFMRELRRNDRRVGLIQKNKRIFDPSRYGRP